MKLRGQQTEGTKYNYSRKKRMEELGKSNDIYFYEFPQTPKTAPLKTIMGKRKQKTKKINIYITKLIVRKSKTCCLWEKSYKMLILLWCISASVWLQCTTTKRTCFNNKIKHNKRVVERTYTMKWSEKENILEECLPFLAIDLFGSKLGFPLLGGLVWVYCEKDFVFRGEIWYRMSELMQITLGVCILNFCRSVNHIKWCLENF